MKCLAREPGNRYQSSKELENEISRWLDGKPTGQRPFSLLWRLRESLKNNVSFIVMVLAVSLLSAALPALALLSYQTVRHKFDSGYDQFTVMVKKQYPAYSYFVDSIAPALIDHPYHIIATTIITLLLSGIIIVAHQRSHSKKRYATIGLILAVSSSFCASIFGGVQFAVELSARFAGDRSHLIYMALDSSGTARQKLYTHILGDEEFAKYLAVKLPDIPEEHLPNVYRNYLDTKFYAGMNNAVLISLLIIFGFYFLFHVPLCAFAGYTLDSKLSTRAKVVNYFDLQICYLYMMFMVVRFSFEVWSRGTVETYENAWFGLCFCATVGLAIFNIVCALGMFWTVLRVLFYVALSPLVYHIFVERIF